MKAGRELDAIVAEKAMGWIGVANRRRVEGTGERTVLLGLPSKDADALRDVPYYSTRIYDAWDVFRQFTDAQIEKAGNNYEVMISAAFSATSDTAPHAICLAALRAVGVEVDHAA